MGQQSLEEPHIDSGKAADLMQLPHFGSGQTVQRLLAKRASLAHYAPQRRHKDQGHQQRGRQGRQQGNRQVFHEFTHHSGPEQQRHEGGKGGGRGGSNRPAHTSCGEGVGLGLAFTLRHLAIRHLSNHDGAVNQHPHGHDQRKQHHDVNGQPQRVDHQYAGKEGTGNGQSHQ